MIAQGRLFKAICMLVVVAWLVTACDMTGTLPTLVPTFTPSPVPLDTPTPVENVTPVVGANATPGATPTPTAEVVSTPTAATPTPETQKLTGVLIVSIDGLRPDALQSADTPNLDQLIERGSVSWTAQTVLPSVTLPSTASMLSGSSPDVHGVRWNVYDLQRGYVALPTLFSVVHDAGLSTALVVGKAKLEHIAVPGTVDTYAYVIGSDADIAGFAAEQLRQAPPDLLVVHLPGVDSAGHAHGWVTSPQIASVTVADEAVGLLLTTLEDIGQLESTLIIVTADHGGIGQSHGGSEPESMTIPWIIAGPGVREGHELQNEIMVYDTAATAVWALGLPLPEQWEGRPVMEAFAP
jgi:arylsulfatase A-like enzyme